MKPYLTDNWEKLDNAGKIFPPTSGRRDPKVFRFSCELYEQVDEAVLNDALKRALTDFPVFKSTLRKGLFWYYLKMSDIVPRAHMEDAPPCSAIYNENEYRLLFDVTFFGKRINLEVYHALTDGTGAMQFLRTVVYYYITIKYNIGTGDGLDYDASYFEKSEDSFSRYYNKTHIKKDREPAAYRITGRRFPPGRMQIISGVVPLTGLIDAAHRYNTTVSVFLSAVFLCAINSRAKVLQRKRPIVLTVPINLRNFFQSASARNFFCTMNIGYDFSRLSGELEDVIRYVDSNFKEKLAPENISAVMNGFIAVERNIFSRIAPLFFKDFVLGIAGRITDSKSTASISNIGKISMPDGFDKYINLFDVFISTKRLQLCVCSYMDRLSMSFSSAFLDTDIQKNFFRTLADFGIEVNISANRFDERGERE